MKFRHTHARCHGFTLLELMVVLVLMGIILSMTTLSVGDGGKYRKLEEEAQRLQTLIGMAREEAILGSKEWRIVFKQDGYRFEQANDLQDINQADKKDPTQPPEEDKGTAKDKWVPIENKIFRDRELADYRLSVTIEDEEYTVGEEDKEAVDDDIIGLVNIYYSGEMMPFELTIEQQDGEDKFTLTANSFGELDLKSSRDKAL